MREKSLWNQKLLLISANPHPGKKCWSQSATNIADQRQVQYNFATSRSRNRDWVVVVVDVVVVVLAIVLL